MIITKEVILKLLRNVEQENVHTKKITQKLKERISEIRDETNSTDRTKKFNSQKLLDQLTISGVLDLLDKYGFKTIPERASPIKTVTAKSKINKKDSAKEPQEEFGDIQKDFDPSSPEEQARLKDFDTNALSDVHTDMDTDED